MVSFFYFDKLLGTFYGIGVEKIQIILLVKKYIN